MARPLDAHMDGDAVDSEIEEYEVYQKLRRLRNDYQDKSLQFGCTTVMEELKKGHISKTTYDIMNDMSDEDLIPRLKIVGDGAALGNPG